MDETIHRLATYGTLAPGRSNHHQLDGLTGTWTDGQVQGRLANAGWGVHLGFPALILDENGPAVDVQLFESADLPAHWSRLDDFEGDGYARVETIVRTARGDVSAYIYALAEDPA
jgi:gamma-glutamylcyclotransferase (GGCT)/AIG2-like uncharacterized protein YtfP